MEEHCYIVSYDLIKPDRNYDELYKALKEFHYWGRLTESTWAIVSSQTHVEIRDTLKKHIDENDRLIVIRSGKAAAWTNILASDEWAKQQLIK